MKFGRKLVATLLLATSVFTTIPVQTFAAQPVNNIKVDLTDEQEYTLHVSVNAFVSLGADGKPDTTEFQDLEARLNSSPGVLPVGKVNLEVILGNGVEANGDFFIEDIFVDIKEGFNTIEFEYRGKTFKTPEIYGMKVNSGKATDLNSSKWYYQTVSEVLKRGLMPVDNSGKFNPDSVATFEDMVEVVSRIAVSNGYGTGSFTRNDITNPLYKYKDTNKLLYLKASSIEFHLLNNELFGMLQDNGNKSLKDTKLTKKDLAQIAVTIPGTIADVKIESNSKPKIKDEKACWINPNAESWDVHGRQVPWSIYAVINNNIMSLDANGNFNPNKPVTKAELAAVVLKVDNLIKTKGTANKISNGYTDPKATYTRFPAYYEGHDNWLIRE